ncbi:MAG: hypothetical protein QOI01_4621 [Mycobacterium sp.]|jgi:hypothetical protein|nr:hypothetical protein [Mycobacterium sp.]
MGRAWRVLVVVAGAAIALSGCVVEGTPTWPGARLNDTLLTAADFPPGVEFGRITEQPGEPGGQGGPPAMPSQPEGCSDGLTRVIAASAQRGPGSAAKYVVAYDGARIVMTVLTSSLDLDQLATTAARCALYLTYFDKASAPIPITTTKLESVRPDSLVYQQTMQLQGTKSSVYFTFENIGDAAMFAIAFPTPAPSIAVKGMLPQTFLDVTAKQAERLH